MKVIYHKDRPLLEFPDEPWRQSLRLAVNRSAGSNSLSVWLAEMGDHHRTPLHWHDTGKVLAKITPPEGLRPGNLGFGRGRDAASLYMTTLFQWRLYRIKTVRSGHYFE